MYQGSPLTPLIDLPLSETWFAAKAPGRSLPAAAYAYEYKAFLSVPQPNRQEENIGQVFDYKRSQL